MTNGIDLNTGLPELPEGYFWRVKQKSVSIMRTLPDTKWFEEGNLISISPNEEFRDVSKPVTVKILGIFPVTRTVTVKECRIVNRSETVVTQDTELSGEFYPDEEDIRYYHTLGAKVPSRVQLHKDLTREDLIPLCEKALQKLDALELLGDYPPKKLEVHNDEPN